MKEKTVKKVLLPHKIVEAMQGFGRFMLVALFGVLLSRAPILDDYAPFGIALCAALPGNYTLAAGLGAVTGYLLPGSGLEPLRYITAIFSAVAFKWILNNLFKISKSAAFSSLVAFVSAIITGLAVASISGLEVFLYISYTVEALLASGAAYFINKAVFAIGHKRESSVFTSHEITSIIITAAILLLSFSLIQVGGVSLARILAVITVLASARYGRETGGAIAGISIGFIMSLSESSLLYIAGAYALGGLIAGVFSPFGRIGCAAAFILSNAIVSLRAGENGDVIAGLYEVLAATVIFLVVPRQWIQKVAGFMSPAAELPRVNGLRRSVVTRLKFAGAALSDVSNTVEEVSTRLSRIHSPAFEDVFAQVESDACKHCGMRAYCWEAERAGTLSMMVDLTKKIRQTGHIGPEDMPESFAKECTHLESVIQSLGAHFNEYASRISAQRRIEEVRSVVSDQFEGVSDMLYDMAEEFEKAEHYDVDAAEKIAEALRASGIIASDVGCCIDKFGRMTVEIRAEQVEGRHINRAKLLEDIQDTIGKKFDAPCVTKASREIYLTLTEKTLLRADFGVAQYSCEQNRMCGDAYDYFNDGKGRAIMIISDGMGTGGRAAVDGAMASGLMSRLIKAGFGFDCSLKIVNSAMLFKSTDESLATLDIACIDFFSGKTEILKAGAPPTVLRRSGKSGVAECSSMPAGILRDIGFERAGTTLQEDDIIVLVSDGAINGGVEWIREELEAWEDGSAQQLADYLAAMAQRRRNEKREDDITVLAAILERNH